MFLGMQIFPAKIHIYLYIQQHVPTLAYNQVTLLWAGLEMKVPSLPFFVEVWGTHPTQQRAEGSSW